MREVGTAPSGSKLRHDGRVSQRQCASLVSLGYEGRTADELINQMVDAGVSVLVDVRLTPLSRKPGLSKNRLRDALADHGIQYVHLPQLGNPKDNRESFRAGRQSSRDRFRRILHTNDGREALAHVVELLDGEVVALLCFERDHTICHRDIVTEELVKDRPGLSLVHL